MDRGQVALTGLLSIFEHVTGPFFKNSRMIFHDILAIFKRCKEVEKILKSSFFEDDEISDLIENIKDELRKEKSAKLARHVADVYRYRTGALKECPKSISEEAVDSQAGSGSAVETPLNDKDSWKSMVLEFRKELDDPLLEIIFDSTIAASLKSPEASTQLPVLKDNFETGGGDSVMSNSMSNGGEDSASGFSEAGAVGENSLCNPDIFQTLISAICDTPDRKLKTKLLELKERVQTACDNVDKSAENFLNDSKAQSIEKSNDSISEICPAKDSSTHKETDEAHLASKAVEIKPESDKEENTVMEPSHRTLCIRVCKALNGRLMLIKQEVNKKWFAYKFGCDNSLSDFDVLDKMMKLEAGLVENLDLPPINDLTEAGKSTATVSDKDEVKVEECLDELKSAEDLRKSPEVEKEESKAHLLTTTIEEEKEDENLGNNVEESVSQCSQENRGKC